MERIGDIQKFILDVHHDRDVTYTKQMRADALCLVAGVKWANKIYVQELTQFVFDMTVELAHRQATETRRGLAEDVINVYIDSHRQLNSSEAHILSLPQRVGSQKQIHNATPSDGRPTVLRLARKNDRNTAAARTGW